VEASVQQAVLALVQFVLERLAVQAQQVLSK
jgi:hypothetical protein